MRLRPVLVLRLAWRDLVAERLLTLCSMAGMAATFTPLLVLAGLEQGVVRGLRQALLEDPHAREIVTVSNASVSTQLLATLAARRDVAFLVPRVRTLAASALVEPLEHPADARRIELIPTAPGDPLLGGAARVADDQLVLSSTAAAFLAVRADERIEARIARLVDGRQEVVRVPLMIAAVAPPAVTVRDAGFVTLPFALAVEAYQEGDAPWTAHPSAVPPGSYAGFRTYARRLDQVPALDAALRGMGIDVVSRAGDVAGLLALDRRLTILFLLVASLGAAGFLVALGSSLWANVERKRSALALLRFAGIGAAGLLLFPLAQSVILSAAGAMAGIGGALAVARVIDVVFAGTLPGGRPLCTIAAPLALGALGATVLGAACAALFAGARAGRIEAWEGVTGT